MEIPETSQLFCPGCGMQMHAVRTQAHYGQPVVIEQCPKCGGLWFDATEFYQVKLGEAPGIENLSIEKLAEDSLIRSETLICPRDHKALKESQDFNILKDLHLLVCPKCGGYWFNRGEFTLYQGKRAEQELKNLPAGRLAEALIKLEELKTKQQQWDRVDNQFAGAAMSIAGSAAPRGQSPQLQLVFDVIMSVLNFLLRK